MSNIIQETIFLGSGLNTDDNINFIDAGSSEWRLNILVSEDGSSGVITNTKGNIRTVDIADHMLSLSSSYQTICSYYNKLTRKVYYFLWSEPYSPLHYDIPPDSTDDYIYDNKLFCYNEDANTLDLIFTDTKNYFGFEYNHPVRDCSMIGDWLYFNPRVSEPKMIDVVRAYNFTNYNAYDITSTYVYGNTVTFNGGLFTANTAIGAGDTPSTDVTKWDRVGDSYLGDPILALDSEFHIAFNVIKMPPLPRPILTYQTDTHIQSNNIRGKLFRASYRYKYFDNSYSVYSAYSDIALPEDDEFYNGEITSSITTNNYIKVEVSPHSPALVKEIEIIFQETGSDWKRMKIINRLEQALLDYSVTPSFSFTFYNNESYVPIDTTKAMKIEDAVPQRANSQEIINKNILCYGGCLEGFDNLDKVDIDVNLTPVIQDITIPTNEDGTVRRNNITSGDITTVTRTDDYGVMTYGEKLLLSTWFAGTLFVNDHFTITIDGKTEVYTITAPDAASVTTLTINLRTFLNNRFPTYNTESYFSTTTYLEIWSPIGSHRISFVEKSLFSGAGTVKAEFTKKRGFKSGANHPFCIFYYDTSLRRWDAQTSKENTIVSGNEMHGTTVYVPMFNENSPALPSSTAYKWTIDWEVDHLPPTGAKYWRWGYAGNSLCSYMIQYVIHTIEDTVAVDGLNMSKIDISPLQTITNTVEATWNQFPTSIISAYEWNKGDRVRFITEHGTRTTLGGLIDGVFDFEILKQDETGMFIFTQEFNWNILNIGEGTLIEIYRPLKSVADTKLEFYEFGDIMPILQDSSGTFVHGGQSGLHNQDSVYGHKAMGTFDGGDIYHIMRTPSQPLNGGIASAFHESMWYSDFYDSDDYDRGKIGFETNFGQRFINIIRYSNQYLQNTLINGLSTFEGDHMKELNDTYGHIIAIMEQGDTLKCYQEKKASSILIGRTEYYDASGKPTLAISENILGAIRYSPSNYSTKYTESLSRNNKFIYGFDVYNGVVWRDSVNGLFPISGRYAEAGGDADYKMQTYFKLKAKALMFSGVDNTSVLSAWDEEFKNLYITFKDRINAENNDTVVFHEPSNRWICFTEFNRSNIEGYDTALEPTYSILRGFTGGLGYTFDEETRFSHFSFTTPAPPTDSNTYIVDEDNTTYVIDDDGSTSIIE